MTSKQYQKLKRKPKLKPIKRLVAELDTVFSQYIRFKAADSNGMVKCYTSDKLCPIKDIQAGHYISRRHYSLRWDERNVKPQSVAENIFNQGNAPVFGRNLQKEYGNEIIDILLLKKNNSFKLERFILEALIEEYKKKIEELNT